MEITNQNTQNNEAPIGKKKWETPQLVFISSGEIQGGQASGLHERYFIRTSDGYSLKGDTGFGESFYNKFVS